VATSRRAHAVASCIIVTYMSIVTSVTADDLIRMADDGKRYELVAGELRMMSPAGWKHGRDGSRLGRILGRHVDDHDLGEMFMAETGFLLSRDPDTVRAPDISFIAKQNLPKEEPESAYWPGAPDLAVEVLSPNDRTGEVDAKIRDWLDGGAKQVWIVDPGVKTITVYRSPTDVESFAVGQTLEGGDVVRGFSCAVADVFGESA
jgi:Uma2 family endonuclease